MSSTFAPSAPLGRPQLITDAAGLRSLADDLSTAPAIAIDTESNSLHAYREEVCLVQISTSTRDYILDPFAFKNLDPLAPVFANPSQVKIFHAAEYDLISLRRDFGLQFSGIFDTMIAARTLGWKHTGLATLLESKFGVHTSKKFQRADWARRPLSPEELRYAQMDTHYLIPLRELQIADLERAGRMEEAVVQFRRMEKAEADAVKFNANDFWKMKGARDLRNPRHEAILRELFVFREERAEEANVPPFKILGADTMIELARLMPAGKRDLEKLRGMTPGQIRRWGAGILQAVERGMKAPDPERPRSRRVDPDVLRRYNALKRWRTEKAKAREVDSDVILPREALWSLAHLPPQTPEDLSSVATLGEFHRESYGLELIDLLMECDRKPARKRCPEARTTKP